jgi:Glycine zipper
MSGEEYNEGERRMEIRMPKSPVLRYALYLLVLGGVSSAWGAQLFIYPSKGQSPEQQNRDRYECHTWAVQQTGFDPTAPQAVQAPPPPSAPQRGGALRGGARGAAVGAVGGAIAGDAGKGAAVGAAAGGLFGGMRQRNQNRSQEQAQTQYAQQQQTQAAQNSAAYDRAMRACLTGRGYTVN